MSAGVDLAIPTARDASRMVIGVDGGAMIAARVDLSLIVIDELIADIDRLSTLQPSSLMVRTTHTAPSETATNAGEPDLLVDGQTVTVRSSTSISMWSSANPSLTLFLGRDPSVYLVSRTVTRVLFVMLSVLS